MFNSGNDFEYEVSYRRDSGEEDTTRRKDYRKGRSSFRPKRRSSRKPEVAIGLAGRRNRRWSW